MSHKFNPTLLLPVFGHEPDEDSKHKGNNGQVKLEHLIVVFVLEPETELRE